MPARSEDTYLFIDGEYLRRIHHDAMYSIFQSDAEIDFVEIKDQARGKRVFLYDCVDDEQHPGESTKDHRDRVAAQEKFFDSIKANKGFHIRLGSVRGGGKRRRQKEVDVLLTVDMLTHGFNGNMEKAVLIAGDLDFRPVVEALVRAGVFVEVWYEPASAARELPGAADFGRRLSFFDLYRWSSLSFRSAYEMPQSSTGTYSAGTSATTVRTGSCDGRGVSLVQNSLGEFVLAIQRADGPYWAKHRDQGVLERFASVYFGNISWV